MRHSRGHVAIGAAALIALGQASLGAEPADDSTPAASNVPGAQSPRIHRDGRVTFALIAALSAPVIRGNNPEEGLSSSLVGPFDTRTAFDGAFANPAHFNARMTHFNARMKLFWLGAGTAEGELMHSSISGAAEALRSSGVRLEYFESQGTAHEWQTWRRDLLDIAPRLFR